MIFVPFLGAAVGGDFSSDDDTESYVLYGGPLLGGGCSILLFVVWLFQSGEPDTLLLTSYIGGLLNLGNLLPILPGTDGARLCRAIFGKGSSLNKNERVKWFTLSLVLALSLVALLGFQSSLFPQGIDFDVIIEAFKS